MSVPPSASRRNYVARLSALGFGALVLFAVASIAIGAHTIDLHVVGQAVLHRDLANAEHAIIWDRRVPRTAAAILAGAAIAVAGALLQSVTRNPLADAGILGINAGAAFIAALALILLGWTSPWAFAGCAMIGAVLTMALVLRIGTTQGGVDPLKIVLGGVAIGGIVEGLGQGMSLVDPQAFARLRGWMLGSVDVASWQPVWLVTAGIALSIPLVVWVLPRLNVLMLGDDQAAAMGVSVARTRLAMLLAVTILCATSTAAIGVITFLGLVAPHIIRRLPRHHTLPDRDVVLLSGLMGAVLLLGADIVGRVLIPSELPAGVVVAFIGAPLLVWLAQKPLVGRV